MKTILLRRDTAARWAAFNVTLGQGEPGFEMDSGKLKIGDGNTPWLELPYFVPEEPLPPGGSDEAVLAHINSELPHPVYDDGPSLILLYENAKV